MSNTPQSKRQRTDTERLDYIEDRLCVTGEVQFLRAHDGDMQMNTHGAVGVGTGCALRDLIDCEMDMP